MSLDSQTPELLKQKRSGNRSLGSAPFKIGREAIFQRPHEADGLLVHQLGNPEVAAHR
jgi:hypothetical protein